MQLYWFNCICNNILALCVSRVTVGHGNDCHHSTSLFKNVVKNYLFIFSCVRSSLLRGGCSLVVGCGLAITVASLLCSTSSECEGFCTGCFQTLELTSCGTRAQLLRSMWNLPGPEMEPVSPASAGGFFTTEPPGKSAVPVLNAFYEAVSQKSEGR